MVHGVDMSRLGLMDLRLCAAATTQFRSLLGRQEQVEWRATGTMANGLLNLE